jgi:hypothetical protein
MMPLHSRRVPLDCGGVKVGGVEVGGAVVRRLKALHARRLKVHARRLKVLHARRLNRLFYLLPSRLPPDPHHRHRHSHRHTDTQTHT